MGSLSGTVALVTGASSGIGEATALALAAEGAQVAIAARRADRLESLAEKLGGPSQALVLKTDVTDEDEVGEMVARTVTEFGRLDTLVNNAGVMLLGPVLGAPTEEWRRMVQLNVLGLLYCTHAGLPHLVHAASSAPRRVADVVNVSSVAGRVPHEGLAVYNATKFAVGAFSESLRQEVTSRHVRVTIVEPGVVATELVGHNRPDIQKTIGAAIGAIEPLRATDIADAIVYAVTRPRRMVLNEILVRPTEEL